MLKNNIEQFPLKLNMIVTFIFDLCILKLSLTLTLRMIIQEIAKRAITVGSNVMNESHQVPDSYLSGPMMW
jgi:hypothetical protein